MKSFSEKDQSIINKADQLVRYYSVPVISNKERTLNTLLSRIESKSTRKITFNNPFRKIAYTSISAAASVAIIVTIYILTSTQSIVNQSNLTSSNRLPDRSRVILEKGSSVKYLGTLNSRKVNLNGSAYFEVEKGKRFIINSKNGHVQVLGTRFQVLTEGNSLIVNCFEGMVRAEFAEKEYLVEAGYRFSGNSTSAGTSKMDGNVTFPEMAKFNKSYNDTDLKDVVSDLEKFFSVKITIKDGISGKFGGSIPSGNIENAMAILCTSLKLNYRMLSTTKIEIYN
jgi:ferric-dicitrate binding protein FerR (iron transport regulator)